LGFHAGAMFVWRINMAIDQSFWKISGEIGRVQESSINSEYELENALTTKIEILNPRWLIFGRQVQTAFNKYVDLLAIDQDGKLIVIELKRDKTPREVVAQALDYASWVKHLRSEEISEIFGKYDEIFLKGGRTFSDHFKTKFGKPISDVEVNVSHEIVIVSSELDPSTERIVTYLSESNIPINVLFFKIYKIGNETFLSRAWYFDPAETSVKGATSSSQSPWNGEFYISFGDDSNRSWSDARKYGFVGAGNGSWYTRTLNLLSVNDRIWVNVPNRGYVGVGIVKDTAKKSSEVLFDDGKGAAKTIYELPNQAAYSFDKKDNEELAEYLVKVDWIKTVDINQAVKEYGFFGNQNTVCKPTSEKWTFTIDKLKKMWNVK
jgi:hypothetical protein